jgi:hypothetical protein
MTKDLADLIVFMVNSYIRPTDIKNMQHQHVDVIKNDERQYLRLRLPQKHLNRRRALPGDSTLRSRSSERRGFRVRDLCEERLSAHPADGI